MYKKILVYFLAIFACIWKWIDLTGNDREGAAYKPQTFDSEVCACVWLGVCDKTLKG